MENVFTSGLNIVGVILAFSILIFVHELGHYLAAILVGVRVEKFMIGFDVWGLGLRKKIKDTEYGIGLLPLGGYVKLAGQSDLPGEEECTGAPDELMSKGPFARALVFVAGVVMNLILGFCVLVAAQMYGVPRVPAVLGYINPSSPAERAGLKDGDRVISIDGRKVRWFEELLHKVALSNKKSLDFKVERNEAGIKTVKTIRVFPEAGRQRGNLLTIGAEVPASRKVHSFENIEDEKSSDLRKNVFPGDRVVAVDGTAIENDMVGGKIQHLVAARAGETVTLTVEKEGGRRLDVEARVYPSAGSGYDYGIRYMRLISEVVEGSPAEKAGIQSGDWIGSVDGTLFEKTDTIISLIKNSSLQEIDITVLRAGEKLNLRVKPAAMTGDPRIPAGKDNFLGLLLAGEKDGEGRFSVKEVLSSGPSEGKIKPGDVLLDIAGEKIVGKTADAIAGQVDRLSGKELRFGVLRDGKDIEIKLRPEIDPQVGVARIGILFNRAGVFSVVEGSEADRLGLSRGDTDPLIRFSADLKKSYVSWSRKSSDGTVKRIAEKPFETPQQVISNPAQYGIKGTLALRLPTHFEMDKTESFILACKQAVPKTGKKIMAIYAFLKKLVVGEMKITAAGGPIIIFKTMYMSASVGFGKLLDIAAFISINLAVLNILPLPVLDGGHLLFVVIELIKGSQPSAKVREYAQYAGFFLLLGLMLLVTAVDVYYSWIR
ncbi:MAG: site-2 protease family protein [Planctomycetota bacterium]|jgi:regulator of sigma E protease